jgi:predicted permease
MFTAIRTMASRVRAWLTQREVDQEFQQEMESHLEMLTKENERRGMTPEEARRAAHVRLGGITQLKETNRELRGLPVLETLLQDARFALRALRKNPGFTAVAVLTLALGIGANTAIFSVVYAMVLKPLPYAEANQLVVLFQEDAKDPKVQTGLSYLNYLDLREQNRIFSEIGGTQRHRLTFTGHGEPAEMNTAPVTPEVFSLFQVKPLAGRTLLPEDNKPGAAPVAILSEGLWRNVFGADPKILGTSIDLDKRSYTIVGIMPDAFRFPFLKEREQVWIPLMQDPLFGTWTNRRSGHWMRVIGRLRPGVSMSQAKAELGALTARFAKAFPEDNEGWEFLAIPMQQVIFGDVKLALYVLLGAVGLVLLIACANIANLLLARATSRAREIAVRATLGAGRSRIIRQMLTETAVLSLLGGGAGVALAYWGVRTLTAMMPPSLPQVNEIRLDYTALGFALVLSAFTNFAVGLVPAFFVANTNPQASLRESGGRSGESGRSRKARSVLAAAEIALAMVLLVAAGLLLRSFSNLTSVYPGFDVQHLVKAEVSLPQFQYSKPEQWLAFADELVKRIQAEPGLQNSAIAVPMPLADGFVNLAFDIPGRPPLSASQSRTADYVSVTPNYFRVMGIPLMAGRLFDDGDVRSRPRVTLINGAMARAYFANENPLGKQLIFAFPPDTEEPREIVGIVGDVRDVSLGENPKPMMYVPFAQSPFWGAVVVVKSTQSVSSVAAAIRQDVARIDKDLPVTDVAAMTDVVEESVAQPKFRTWLLALFAGMALVLAATGIFGVISYSVSRRTQEIGIRMALGASRSAIMRLVLSETMELALAGLALGVPCALGASHLVGHLLFGVSASDPATLASVGVALAAVALLAGYVPVRRAMCVDPLEALRHE